MSRQLSWEFRRFQRRQKSRNTPWLTYKVFLARVCQDYQDLEIAREVRRLLSADDIGGLLDLADAITTQKYCSATEHFVAHQIAALIKKYPFPKGLNPHDPEQTARKKFLDSEDKCRQMNLKLRNPPSGLEGNLHSMRRFISSVIGEEVPFASIWESCDFGPGASIGTHGNATNFARKVLGHWSVSPEAQLYAKASIKANWQLFEGLCPSSNGLVCYDAEYVENRISEAFRLVAYNKIAFVPKTAKTHRSIAVEPLWNGYVQKGIDTVLRNRLRRIGLDLTDQSRNALFARKGSESDTEESFVTIDLESASDSISIEICRQVLPHDWFYFLNRIRSKAYRHGSEITTYEKFCSMGNGFCFPLETLLFAAACNSVGAGTPGHDFLVYGDDIIVRKKHAASLIALLNEIGFAVNSKKTFIEGPFRESCGSDWFNGEDVRPVVLDDAFDSLESFIKFLNAIRRSRRCFVFFEGVRDWIISLIPPRLRFVRPIEHGSSDSSYVVSQDEFLASVHARWSKDLQTWTWLELIHHAVKDVKTVWIGNELNVHMIAALRGSSSEAPFTVRRKTRTSIRRNPEITASSYASGGAPR
jgi:hypothetical protein